MKTRKIAIDGVASSGKSTIGKILAERLNYEFIDSGFLYRLATLIALEKDLKKGEYSLAVTDFNVDIKDGKIFLDGDEVPLTKLRDKNIDALVSPVSEDSTVREVITKELQRISEEKNVVMVGRDIGSVVLPDAFLKIFLTATLEERASRRFKELILQGVNTTFEEVYENLKMRDIIDSSRSVAPLTIPKDAYVIDTTNLKIDEVITLIMEFIRGKEYALRNSKNYSDSLF
ncbi:(d)CMP kinase [Caldisericum exile]|uniref:Cytidylate kinase n=1 Tax=Caldisericum exile (strain DSM 21853 / NBRC 104410 / AZM16c01) TaxID=511051 RepID=A0A7U6GDV9_CALEA|nr:(d)CMP kinase [Caldisericum exile]BAL80564.1 cytidylate kinase [Caldisericum exile AZM16c01]